MGRRSLMALALAALLLHDTGASGCVEAVEVFDAPSEDGDGEESSLLMQRLTMQQNPLGGVLEYLFVNCKNVWVDEVEGGAFACFAGSVDSPKPLFVFGHGDGLPAVDYQMLMRGVASKGFLAIAYNSCVFSESGDQESDCRGGEASFLELLKIISAVSSAPRHQLEGAPPADLTAPVTVGGHSAGGRAALMAAAVGDSQAFLQGTVYKQILDEDDQSLRKAAQRIGAVIALHPSPMYDSSQDPDVPGFVGAIGETPAFVICSAEDEALPADSCWYDFRSIRSPNRIYLNLAFGGHSEILFPGVETSFVADFGAAFALGDEVSRQTLYGDCRDCMRTKLEPAALGQRNDGNGTVGLLLCADFAADWPEDAASWCESPLKPADLGSELSRLKRSA